jgi:hypothetical protein
MTSLHRARVYLGLADETATERRARGNLPWWQQPVVGSPLLALGFALAFLPALIGLDGHGWAAAQLAGCLLIIGSLVAHFMGLRRTSQARPPRES